MSQWESLQETLTVLSSDALPGIDSREPAASGLVRVLGGQHVGVCTWLR